MSLELLPLEILLNISKYLYPNNIYNLCLVNKNMYYNFYNDFSKKNYKESNKLYNFINNINIYPLSICIITHKLLLRTRIDNEEIYDLTDIKYKDIRHLNISTYPSIFTRLQIDKLKSKYSYSIFDGMIYLKKVN